MKNYLIVLLYLMSSVSLALPPYDSQGRLFGAPLTFKEITTPSAPAANQISLYAKGDDKLYFQTSLGVEKPVGSGDGASGDYGYLVNGGFEDTTTPTTGWTLGSGVTSTLALDPIEGKQAVTLSFTSLNGTALSQCLTTPTSLTGQTMGYEIQLKTSTTNLQACSMRDNAELQCADVASDGNWHKMLFNYPGSGSLNDCVKVKTTTSTTGSVTADAGYVGLARNLGTNSTIPGRPVTMTLASASGAITNATVAAYETIIGDRAFYEGRITFSGASSSFVGMYLSLPTGRTINTANPLSIVGAWQALDAGITLYGISSVSISSSTSVAFTQSSQSVHTGTVPSFSADLTNTYPFTFGNTDEVRFKFDVPLLQGPTQVVTQNPASIFGMMMAYPGAQCPDGWVKADGGTTPAILQSLYGPTLPNPQGLALSWAGSQTIGGVTYSRTLLSAQGDQMQGHYHSWTAPSSSSGGNLAFNIGSGSASGPQQIGAASSDGTNGTPRVGLETRMANMAWTPCISMSAVPAPLVVGGVTTSSSGSYRQESITFGGSTVQSNCTSSPCTIYSQSGFVSSVTRGGTGFYTLNFSPAFSGQPTCICNSTQPGTGPRSCSSNEAATTTSVTVSTHNGGTGVDSMASVVCFGPK